jgi:hypothetical protein
MTLAEVSQFVDLVGFLALLFAAGAGIGWVLVIGLLIGDKP